MIAAIRRYPLILAALIVAAISGALTLTSVSAIAPWIIGGFSVFVALREGVSMFKAFLKGRVGLDVLAVTAILATVLVGEYWASLVIVFMIVGGTALEDFAAGRAERELSSLLERVPQIAHRVSEDGSITDVPATEIKVGDRLLIRPSEIVPVDGTLQSFAAAFDESSLTGESMPVEKVDGDPVMSGSINGQTAVEIIATMVAADSQYQRIVSLVAEAKESKAPLVRLADRYAVPFTLIAYLIAGIAWWLGKDPARFAEVLVVATPCPLLIAAPVAFMSGMSSAAKTGIVIKNAGTLEKLSRAKTVALDKTGTLTHGKPQVVDVRPVGMSKDELLVLVGSAEQYSSHVLAGAMREAAAARELSLIPAPDAHEVETHGVEATISGKTVFVGKPKYVAKNSSGVIEPELQPGEAAIQVSVDGIFAGSIILRDEIRAETKVTLERLRDLNISHIMMLTGDIDSVAKHIGQELGVDDIRSECLPKDKVTAVSAATPRPVIMVGDGVNDAPVLAASDVGIAMGAKGSTSAAESADVVILMDDLSRVAKTVQIGRRTVKIALQSIWLGMVMSIALMGVAAAGFLPAILGAATQEIVDLVAILGALRALRSASDK